MCPKMCIIQSTSNKAVRETLPAHWHINYTFSDYNNFKIESFFKIEISESHVCLIFTRLVEVLGQTRSVSIYLISLQPQAIKGWIKKEILITGEMIGKLHWEISQLSKYVRV